MAVALASFFTLTTALVGFTAAPAAAASLSLSVADSTNGAKTTVTYTRHDGAYVEWKWKVCDIKADGHHAEGMVYLKGRSHAGDSWSDATYELSAYDGSGTCTYSSVTYVSYYCDYTFVVWAGVFEGGTQIGTPKENRIDISTC